MMLLLVFFVFFILSFLVYNYCGKTRCNHIPSPKCWPLIGHALLGIGPPEVIFSRCLKFREQYPRFVRGKMGLHEIVFLYDPDDIEAVMKSGNLEKSVEYHFVRAWLGNSIGLRVADAQYKIHKKIILPAFRLESMLQFFDSFNRQATAFVNSVKKYVDTNIEFDIMDYLYSMQMSVLLETQLGIGDETLAAIGLKYGNATSKVCEIIHRRMYTLWKWPDFSFQFTKDKKELDGSIAELKKLTKEVINQKKARRGNCLNSLEGERKTTVFLDMLLEAALTDDSLTDEQIQDEVMFMMFAGQDTSAITVAFVLSLLAYYQDVQKKVHDELDEILGSSKSEDSISVTYGDINKMKFLDAVIHETLRLYPSLPLMGRTSDVDIHLGDYTIPKKTSIALVIFQLHRNASHFSNPEEFRPERFLDTSASQRHPYSYIPFSIGQRACLGFRYSLLSMKVTLATFLRQYKVISTRHPSSYKLLAETTLKRKEGWPIILERRSFK